MSLSISSESLLDSSKLKRGIEPQSKPTAHNIVWMENGFAHTDSEHHNLMFDKHFHGRNIKIDEGGRTAHKIKKGAKEALVVTNRPMITNELFEVEVGGDHGFKGVKQEMKSALKGKESIRIGVTVHCPSDMVSMSAQHSMKRMNSGTWMMMAESIVENAEVKQTLNRYSLKELVAGDKVGIMRVPEFNGSLVVFVNGAPLGVIATDVAENVYGFVELQGECERVAIIRRKIQQEGLPLEIRAMRERGLEIKLLKKRLDEKDEMIDTLQGQMEMMRKQVIMMKTSQNGIKHSMEITQDTETQTSPINGGYSRSSSTSSSRASRKTKDACCVIC